MAKNHGSAVFQVQKALKAVFTPGESRHVDCHSSPRPPTRICRASPSSVLQSL